MILNLLAFLEMLLCCHLSPEMHAVSVQASMSVPVEMRKKMYERV